MKKAIVVMLAIQMAMQLGTSYVFAGSSDEAALYRGHTSVNILVQEIASPKASSACTQSQVPHFTFSQGKPWENIYQADSSFSLGMRIGNWISGSSRVGLNTATLIEEIFGVTLPGPAIPLMPNYMVD